jgi:hypothetical protein
MAYISVVFYGRNDNHGENFFNRMSSSFNAFVTLFEKYNVDAEIVVVDYNPLDNTPLLKDVLKPKVKLKNTKLKFIVVPNEFHMQFDDSNKLPIHNMVARNIGISRSSGDYILSTTFDIIPSHELIEFIANKKLDSNKYYRLDRIDVKRDVANIDDTLDQIEYCKNNIIDIHIDTEFGREFNNTGYSYQHSNQSGDFQLAHKDAWSKVNGYPIYDSMSTHADTIMCYMFAAADIKQEILQDPLRVYHIDHDSRWLWPVYTKVLRTWRMLSFDLSKDQVKELKDDFYAVAKKAHHMSEEKSHLENIGVELMTKEKYTEIITDMLTGKRSYKFNSDDWGYTNTNFDEYIF